MTTSPEDLAGMTAMTRLSGGGYGLYAPPEEVEAYDRSEFNGREVEFFLGQAVVGTVIPTEVTEAEYESWKQAKEFPEG